MLHLCPAHAGEFIVKQAGVKIQLPDTFTQKDKISSDGRREIFQAVSKDDHMSVGIVYGPLSNEVTNIRDPYQEKLMQEGFIKASFAYGSTFFTTKNDLEEVAGRTSYMVEGFAAISKGLDSGESFIRVYFIPEEHGQFVLVAFFSASAEKLDLIAPAAIKTLTPLAATGSEGTPAPTPSLD